MRITTKFFPATITLFVLANAYSKSDDALQATFESEILPNMERYCFKCHGEEKQKADVAFTNYQKLADVRSDSFTWEAAMEMLEYAEMPPEDEDQPTLAERELIINWIRDSLFTFDPDNPDPGRVTIRRLNRAEYNNTIRDLVGVPFNPADDFPLDDAGYGFDNIGDVQTLPPILLEMYLNAADKIMDQAIVTEKPTSITKRYPANLLEVGFNALGDRGDGWLHLVSLEEDDAAVEIPIAAPGDYAVRVMAYADPDGGILDYDENDPASVAKNRDGISSKPPMISFKVGDTFIEEFLVSTNPNNPGVYETRIGTIPGNQRIRAVVHRERGGENELSMKNGRIGKQQKGIVYVKWLEIEGPLPGITQRYDAHALAAVGAKKLPDEDALLFDSNGETSQLLKVKENGPFLLRAYAYADQAGSEPAKMEFRIDGETIKTFEVLAPAKLKPIPGQRLFSAALLDPMPIRYETEIQLTSGEHQFTAAFVNDFQDPQNPNPNLRDRNLYIQSLETVNLDSSWEPPPMLPLVARHFEDTAKIKNKKQRARKVISSFASTAWRRPASEQELDRLMNLYELADKGNESFEASVKLAMKATLASPNFIFRKESQPNPNDPDNTHPIDEYALASRLSYFIWSSLPDEELFEFAKNGKLRENLREQTVRMLASPKAQALVDNFAGQWLQTRRMNSVHPDRDLFGSFDQFLRDDMRQETELLFESIMRENRSITEFLNADYTFLNERLANHYGMAGITGETFQRVSLADTPRRGVLTHGSVLTLTSNPNRTSPVKRGKWVLDNLLGTPLPPPPPDVPELEEAASETVGSLREQMEQYRENPNCSSCHERMDPIGFALENFDPIGAWRGQDAGQEIDSSGVLTSGESFNGAVELLDLLASSKEDEFLTSLSQKMLTYALSRGIEYYDKPAVENIVSTLRENDNRFETLILGVVNSVPFQMRRGEGVRNATPDTVASANN